MPVDAQLAAQPGDWRAAFAVLIDLMSGGADDHEVYLSLPDVLADALG